MTKLGRLVNDGKINNLEAPPEIHLKTNQIQILLVWVEGHGVGKGHVAGDLPAFPAHQGA